MAKITFLLFIGLSLLLFYSCANGQVKKEYYENGDLKSKTCYKNDLKNGEEKVYYPSGKLKSVYNYKDGVKEGPYFGYYENGKLYRNGNNLNGHIDGMYYEFTNTGDTIFKVLYSNNRTQLDIRYEKNKPFRIMDFKNKWMTIYNEDGTVKDSIPIKGWD